MMDVVYSRKDIENSNQQTWSKEKLWVKWKVNVLSCLSEHFLWISGQISGRESADRTVCSLPPITMQGPHLICVPLPSRGPHTKQSCRICQKSEKERSSLDQ